MSLLIFGHIGDVHAASVKWGLESLGVHVEIFCNENFPTTSSISVSSNYFDVKYNGPSINSFLSSFGAVWNRRALDVALPDELHPDDREIARKTCREFLDSLRHRNVGSQVWVNPRPNQLFIDNKINQLKLAREIGFRIPKTLFSNNPDHVRQFLKNQSAAIIKTLRGMRWRTDSGAVVVATEKIGDADELDDLAIRSCPMIYQEQIMKSYECRIFVCGRDVLNVQIDSQDDVRSSVDWRYGGANQKVSQIPCPAGIEEKILKFMDAAGILHGSFDFAVTKDGEYVFFEINEQGQSLWMESRNPDIRVLDRLVQFMRNPTRDYRFSGQTEFSYLDFLKSDQGIRAVSENREGLRILERQRSMDKLAYQQNLKKS